MARVLEKYPLTIIMPVLNCLEYTKRAIESIKTKTPYQLILIDNNSTDGTKDYFKTLKKDPRIFPWRFTKNMGVSASWNFGIVLGEVAFHSEYFLILNNDIILHPETIDILIERIQEKNVLLYSATDVSGQVVQGDLVKSLPRPLHEVKTEAPEFPCFIIKKETLKRVGYFDENFYPAYFEDNDYHRRIKVLGSHALKTNVAQYFHFGSRTKNNDLFIKDIINLGYNPNWEYYKRKWGGDLGQEKFTTPFQNL